MATLGKCKKCGVRVYDLEGVTAAKACWHKMCFKCETCNWQLTLTNYKCINDKVYCKNHYPVTGFGTDHIIGTQSTDSLGLANPINAPKLDTVNQQVRGDSGKTQVGLDSMHISKPVNAPKLDTVNDQVRGDGGKTQVGLDSIHIAKPVSAPKLDTVNDQVRGDGGKTQVGLDSIHIAKPLDAPKLDGVMHQVR
ncbi:LIM-type zinc finger-containing protein [Heterostelium album PN500]|uniref:LIM-type zinc finger-containing protein n=1 Tax=Heterostelium pallidum (strain ATCC 26659 / Pp 5 / PN500) TaxID=670386 RepID=D3BU00_HETP5|nr:LIM-type zinc finger-containing protein [Heterostelium album PN500]EFA75186.1 LIM-type zinc finger-containing protein [Heterostelium album PN500]|eukprot:XP_020427320.1 LIM-type zinc finger-containing protein [Heterostelium album PN500]